MTILSLVRRGNPCVHFRTRLAVLFTALFICEHAPSQQVSLTEVQDRINANRRLISVAEHDHLSSAKIGFLWSQLATSYAQLADFARAEDAYIHSMNLLKLVSEQKANYATLLDNFGVFYLAYNRKEEAKSYLKMALILRRERGDAMPLGVSQMHLAELALADHRFKEAENDATEAQRNLVATGDSGRKGLISTLVVLTYARCAQKKCAEGTHDVEQAMELARAEYPSDSLPVGHLLMAIGFAKWKSGDKQEAEKSMVQGIRIITEQNVPGSPYSRNALLEYRAFLEEAHRTLDAKRIDDQLQSVVPPSCTNCTVSVHSLTNAMR